MVKFEIEKMRKTIRRLNAKVAALRKTNRLLVKALKTKLEI